MSIAYTPSGSRSIIGVFSRFLFLIPFGALRHRCIQTAWESAVATKVLRHYYLPFRSVPCGSIPLSRAHRPLLLRPALTGQPARTVPSSTDGDDRCVTLATTLSPHLCDPISLYIVLRLNRPSSRNYSKSRIGRSFQILAIYPSMYHQLEMEGGHGSLNLNIALMERGDNKTPNSTRLDMSMPQDTIVTCVSLVCMYVISQGSVKARVGTRSWGWQRKANPYRTPRSLR